MPLVKMALISLAVGLVAAGLMWYGWGLCENLYAALLAPRREPGPQEEAEKKGAAKPPEKGEKGVKGP